MLGYTLAECEAYLEAIARAYKKRNADTLMLLRAASVDDGKPYTQLMKALQDGG